MFLTTSFIKIFFVFQIVFNLFFSVSQVNCFTNIFGELFNDLKFGTFETDILGQRLPNRKLKCAQGSHPFNGSCYFISDIKYIETDKNEILQNILKILEEKKQLLNPIKSLSNSAERSQIPSKAKWNEALNLCNQLDPYSSLIQFNEKNSDFDFIVDLLKNYTSQQSGKYFEQKYWIGLTYNSTWKWLNGMALNDSRIESLIYRPHNDVYRQCSYLNVRDNGEMIIELANCRNDQHNYICKYVMDRCYNNSYCGKNGACVNVPYKQSFECRCRIFYDGERCEKWSNQGIQMIIAVFIVISALIFLIVNAIYTAIIHKKVEREERLKRQEDNYKRYIEVKKRKESVLSRSFWHQKSLRYSIQMIEKNVFKFIFNLIKRKLKLFLLLLTSFIISILLIIGISFTRYNIIKQRIERYKNSTQPEPEKTIDKDQISEYTTFFSFDVCKVMNSQFLEDFILIIISLSLTLIIYFWNAFKCNRNHEYFCRFSKFSRNREESRNSESEESNLSLDYNVNNYKNTNKNRISRFLSLKKFRNFTFCGFRCICGIEFPIPMNPFSKRNRFLTGVIYAAYTYNILKIFEFLLIGEAPSQALSQGKDFIKNINISMTSNLSAMGNQLTNTFQNATQKFTNMTEQGILMDLIKQICVVIIIGLRYYPVLLCIDLKRKSKFCYFLCTFYVLFLLIYYVYMNTFCLLSAYSSIKQAYKVINSEKKFDKIDFPNYLRVNKVLNETQQVLDTTKSSRLRFFSNLKLAKNRSDSTLSPGFLNKTEDSDLKKNVTTLIKDQLFMKNFMYEKFLFYTVLCLISLYMITEFSILMIQSIRKKKEKQKRKHKCSCCKKRMNSDSKSESEDEDIGVLSKVRQGDKVDNEINYTKELFRRQKPISFIKHIINRYIYENKKHFRFSKEFINTNLIAIILLYYITSLIIRKSNQIVSLSSNLFIIMINFIFKLSTATEMSYLVPSNAQINNLITSLYDNIGSYIVWACCFTTGIYVVQLFFGIKSYHRHVLNGYRGVYEDIPSPKKFSNVKLAASSLHYSGYAIGYLLWGYLILFEVSLVVIIVTKFLIRFYFLTENLAKIVLPILTIYLLKRILIWYLCSYFITENSHSSQRFVLKNRKFYFILNHFNFFFDCFLGSFVCFMRMGKSSLAALFFMPRLDYSIFGRFLESKDMGFISYVSFIHMEVNQTHPVKLAFCDLLRQSQDELFCVKEKHSKTMRNKWFVMYTLIKNPNLKRFRKGYLFKQSLIPKVETLEHFIKRQKNKIFEDKSKRRSKSVPCLLDEIADKRDENKTSTIDYRSQVQPPVPPKRQTFLNYNFSSVESYEPTLDSTISTQNTTLNLNSPNRINRAVFFNSPNSSQFNFSNRKI
ncbi:unnamed protein product [Brachionus calyciflorus]|uniref:EGF-like domain-containing protein n=1 Tax=Brachionus calyciflorus TaxID=104777 RepID=A0A813R1U1_9BILA|nr:unnamed protein product [Brachionus calyciflorus]